MNPIQRHYYDQDMIVQEYFDAMKLLPHALERIANMEAHARIKDTRIAKLESENAHMNALIEAKDADIAALKERIAKNSKSDEKTSMLLNIISFVRPRKSRGE